MTNSAKRTSRPISVSDTTRSSARRQLPIGLLLVGGAVVIVLLLVVVLAVANQPEPVSAEAYQDMPAEWVDGRALGNPEAPVVIELWEDFRCPACAQWTQQIKPQLMEDFVAEDAEVAPGSVRLEYNYFPLSSHGETAILAALGAECAREQGAFWPYHDRLFTATNQGPAGFAVERLTSYASDLGLDESRFSQCLTSQEHFDEVQASLSEAIELGLNATPSIIVDGQLVENPFGYAALSDLIQQQLAADE